MQLGQSQFGGHRSRERRASGAVALVCLVLLALLAMVQVAHMHPVGQDADHCLLCIVMHSAAPVAAAAAVVQMVQLRSRVPALAVRTMRRHYYSRHTTRPPPAGC